MKWYLDEVTFNNRDFIKLGFAVETWIFSEFFLNTPHGTLEYGSVRFIDQGPLVGLEIRMDESSNKFKFSDIQGCPSYMGEEEVGAVAIMRRPNNAWLWLYMFDRNLQPIASFCGHDDLDEFSKYVDNIKSIYIR